MTLLTPRLRENLLSALLVAIVEIMVDRLLERRLRLASGVSGTTAAMMAQSGEVFVLVLNGVFLLSCDRFRWFPLRVWSCCCFRQG
jgi:hypothetical protein